MSSQTEQLEEKITPTELLRPCGEMQVSAAALHQRTPKGCWVPHCPDRWSFLLESSTLGQLKLSPSRTFLVSDMTERPEKLLLQTTDLWGGLLEVHPICLDLKAPECRGTMKIPKSSAAEARVCFIRTKQAPVSQELQERSPPPDKPPAGPSPVGSRQPVPVFILQTSQPVKVLQLRQMKATNVLPSHFQGPASSAAEPTSSPRWIPATEQTDTHMHDAGGGARWRSHQGLSATCPSEGSGFC